jgi:hypothetical protein
MFFDFDPEQPFGKTVTAALKRRDMVPYADGEWEVHGPHWPNMDY